MNHRSDVDAPGVPATIDLRTDGTNRTDDTVADVAGVDAFDRDVASRRRALERKLAQLRHTAERYRRQARVVGPLAGHSFERRASELELTALVLQARFGDRVGMPFEAPTAGRQAGAMVAA